MWVMRSAMKPAGTKSEGRNLVLIVLIPSWKPASSIVTTASKLSQSQFCTPKHKLFRWRKELCRIEEPSKQVSSTLVPVIVSETAPAAQSAAPETPVPSQPRRKRSDVTIELGRGRRVRVDSDIDTEALGRILDCVLGRR
jgi:hypothetical protein